MYPETVSMESCLVLKTILLVQISWAFKNEVNFDLIFFEVLF